MVARKATSRDKGLGAAAGENGNEGHKGIDRRKGPQDPPTPLGANGVWDCFPLPESPSRGSKVSLIEGAEGGRRLYY